MTNQCKSGVAILPVQATSMSQGHLCEGMSETGKQQSLRPYRERTRTSTVRSHGKAERVVTARRLADVSVDNRRTADIFPGVVATA